MSTSGGYHEYIGRCSVHRRVQYNVLMVSPDLLNIPRCTEHTLYRVIIKSSCQVNRAHFNRAHFNFFSILLKFSNWS